MVFLENETKYDLLEWMDLFFQNMDDWSFDVFAVNENGDGHSLKYVGYELLQRYDLINKFKVRSLQCYLLLKVHSLHCYLWLFRDVI